MTFGVLLFHESVSVDVQVGVGVTMLFSVLFAYAKHVHRSYSKLIGNVTDEDGTRLMNPQGR